MDSCPVCGGQLAFLGTLGQRVHFRCSGCGLDSSCDASEVAAAPDEDEDVPPDFEEPAEGES